MFPRDGPSYRPPGVVWVLVIAMEGGYPARCTLRPLASVAVFHNPQVILFSEDVTRAVAFYSGLGFAETFRTPAQGEPIHVDLVLDGYKVGIASVASTRDDHGLDPIPTGQRAAVILWTHDTERAYMQLTEGGIPGLRPPHEWLGRLLIAWVADPDGNPIQIVQPLRHNNHDPERVEHSKID